VDFPLVGLRFLAFLVIRKGYYMLTSEQVKAARSLLRWNQEALAEASGVSLPAIKRLEQMPGQLSALSKTVDAIVAAFKNAGVDFIDENGGGAGVRLRKGREMKDQFVVEEADETSIRIRALSTADRFSFVIKDRKIGSAAMASRATPVEKSRAALLGDEPKAFNPTLQNQARSFALHEARTRGLID
jgi:transcriptional regulator with XRE-family HTH domain